MPMRLQLSIRYKILITYLMVFVLFVSLVLLSWYKRRDIEAQLHGLENGLIPMLTIAVQMGQWYPLSAAFKPGAASFASPLQTLHWQQDFSLNMQQHLLALEQRLNQPVASRPDPKQAAILIALHQVRSSWQQYQASLQSLRQPHPPTTDLSVQLLQQRDQLRGHVAALTSKINIAIQDKMERVSSLERLVSWYTIWFSFIGCLLVMLLAFLALIMLQPIRHLTLGVQRLAQGDYQQRLNIKSGDEVGVLAREFNKMASSIERLMQNEQLAAIGKISAQITHEIRNPLHALGLNLALLREDVGQQLTAPARDLFNTIEREIHRLNKVAALYLSFTRPSKRQSAQLQLPILLDETIDLMTEELRRKKIKLITEIDTAMRPLWLDGDACKQAILNLLKNAMESIQASPATAECSGHIWLRAYTAEDKVVVEIEDDGPGIDAAARDKVFSTFYTTKSYGTGLGLALTQKIIEEQHGTIEVVPRQPRGVIFRLTFK